MKAVDPVSSVSSPGPREELILSRPLTEVSLGLCLCILTLGMQLQGLNRSFWLDEVWIANAVTEPTFSKMVYYEGWLNVNPPLFLILVRFVSRLFGISHESMRVVPVLFGLLSVPMMLYLALRFFSIWYAAGAVLLVSLSPAFVVAARSLKPYTADVFVALALLILGYQFLRTRAREALYFGIGAYSLCGFLSYQAVVFIPIFFYGACVDRRPIESLLRGRNEISVRWLDVLFLLAVTLVVSATNYFLFVKPNSEPTLEAYWTGDFYHGASVAEFSWYFVRKLSGLTVPFFFVDRFYPQLGMVALAIMIVGVLGFLIRSDVGVPEKPRGTDVVLLLTLPILGLAILNLLKLYPMPSAAARLVLFVSPVVSLVFISGIQSIVRAGTLFARKIISAHWITARIEVILPPVVFAAIVFLFGLSLLLAGPLPYFGAEPREDARAAVDYLAKGHSERDVLYVHSSMREHYKFYSRSRPINRGRVVIGNIGWPCCPRAYVSDKGLNPDIVIGTEIQRLNLSSQDQKLRLLLTERKGHWLDIGRDDSSEFKIRLERIGCVRTHVEVFSGVRIDEYVCQTSNR